MKFERKDILGIKELSVDEIKLHSGNSGIFSGGLHP